MAAIRVSTIFTAATVLLFAWLASRARLDAGIALAVVGLALAYTRGLLAIPAIALGAAVVWAPIGVAIVAPVLVMLAVAVHFAIVWQVNDGPGPGGSWGGGGGA